MFTAGILFLRYGSETILSLDSNGGSTKYLYYT